MKSKMSPKRGFLTAMLGGKPDRAPVGNVVSVATTGLMEQAGAWFPEAHLNAESMARLAAAGHIYSAMTQYAGFQRRPGGGGSRCQIDWGGPEMMPGARTHPFAQQADFNVPEDWIEAPSIQVVLQALHLLRHQLGDRVVIRSQSHGAVVALLSLDGDRGISRQHSTGPRARPAFAQCLENCHHRICQSPGAGWS